MKLTIRILSLLIIVLPFACKRQGNIITVTDLLEEMTSLQRLSSWPDISYRVVQFSSYDRRSTSPADTLWFANEDGFGGEPIPGFRKILKEPDTSGIGEYLICEINSPGVIQRLWTAAMTGKIRFFADDMMNPVYEGEAVDFFWKPLEKLAGIADTEMRAGAFRQFDATYLPVPFARYCRIEWIGNIKEPHFYHVGIRLYEPGVSIEPFSADNFRKNIQKLASVSEALGNQKTLDDSVNDSLQKNETSLDPDSGKDIFSLNGTEAIEYFTIKIKAQNLEAALRQTILNLYFDNSMIPQVQSPVGDFFGAAPGLNPFHSFPFSVLPDSTMICRFVMPYQKSASIKIENHTAEKIVILSSLKTARYKWEKGKSLYFNARWKISNGLTTGNTDKSIVDIPYLKVQGSGRIVGAAAYLYNPCNVPTSWGNWWGEGDEKIFVDRDTFPSFFGTGSEDYFNYSWSSPKIFSFSYCGQPRNDGPSNRGYVSDYRWHIADDITFSEKLDFYMELRHHDNVADFSYGRIVYFYALPPYSDDYTKIVTSDIREIPYLPWSPRAYLGCSGYSFFQAESLNVSGNGLETVEDKLCAEGKMLTWTPASVGEEVTFSLTMPKDVENRNIGFTLAHIPGGGIISVFVNGKKAKIDGSEIVDLSTPWYRILDNHFTEKVNLKAGVNKITLRSEKGSSGTKTGIDFIWVKY